MCKFPAIFREFLHTIEPRPERRRLAQDCQTKVREHLEAGDAIRTVEPHTRLQGSYARSTAIGDIHDVDILVFVDESQASDPATVLRKLKKGLEGVEGAIGPVDLTTQRRSVRVDVKSAGEEFTLDVVPALLIDGGISPIRVPDKQQRQWIKTDPIGYGEALSELNERYGRKVVPMIKLVKHWRDRSMAKMRPKSFWLECAIFEAFYEGRVETDERGYAEVFVTTMEALWERFRPAYESGEVPRVKDPSTGKVVTSKWERTHFEAFARNLEEASKVARSALEDEDLRRSFRLWKRLFGELFTQAAGRVGQSLANAARQGALRVSSEGRIAQGKDKTAWMTIPSHRFYGEELP